MTNSEKNTLLVQVAVLAGALLTGVFVREMVDLVKAGQRQEVTCTKTNSPTLPYGALNCGGKIYTPML